MAYKWSNVQNTWYSCRRFDAWGLSLSACCTSTRRV